jgi:hypothetical protein
LTGEECERFPSLRPTQGWDADAVWDLVQDFFVDRGARVTTMLLAQAGDDASMGRLLRTSIRHYLIDQARRTEAGALRRRLEELLHEEPSIARVPDGQPGAGRWRLAGTTGPPWGGSLQELVRAAYAVPAGWVRWSSSRRRRPISDRASLVAILQAVLGAAGGSLETAQLVGVFVLRFPATVEAGEVPMSEGIATLAAEPAGDRPDAQVVAAEQDAEAAERASMIFDELTPQERLLLPHLDKTAGEQAAVLGCGRSQANVYANRLKDVLRGVLGGVEARGEVVLELSRRCTVT